MYACSTVGGGVMFIPEKIEKKGAVSYSDLVKEERTKNPMRAFGKKVIAKRKLKKAA